MLTRSIELARLRGVWWCHWNTFEATAVTNAAPRWPKLAIRKCQDRGLSPAATRREVDEQTVEDWCRAFMDLSLIHI